MSKSMEALYFSLRITITTLVFLDSRPKVNRLYYLPSEEMFFSLSRNLQNVKQ